MDKHEVVPDVIDEVPREVLEVVYDGNIKVNLGNELTPTQVKDQPHVSWKGDVNKLYTLLMTDPDAPSRENPTYREIRHWEIINIPGNSVIDGQVLVEYRGSGPPKDTGLHRYIFLLFEQTCRIECAMFVSKLSREGRLNTSTRKLMEDFHLSKPIAGNFYQAQYDEYVDIRNAAEQQPCPNSN